MSHLSPTDPAPPPRQPAGLDLERTVEEDLTLTTIDGGEDYLHADLVALPAVQAIQRHHAELTATLRGTLASLHTCRLYTTAAIPLPGPVGEEPRLEPLVASMRHGVLHALTSEEELRFRVGVADSELRTQVIGQVEATLGWRNDPTGWDVNIITGPRGWMAQIGALHYSRRFGHLDRQPWSTTPIVAEIMIRLAKLTPGSRVHDPCCGTATLLITAHHNSVGTRLSGTDHDPASLALAQANLLRHQVPAELVAANATPFPAERASLDRVVANLPFGKLVGSHQDNATLYPAILNEIARTLTGPGRAVVLTEDKRLLRQVVDRTKGIKLIKERLLRYHGATPTAYVLARTRR